jgi:hypothetical protein
MDPRPRTPPIVRRSSKAQASQPAPGTRQGALAGVVSLIARRVGAVEPPGSILRGGAISPQSNRPLQPCLQLPAIGWVTSDEHTPGVSGERLSPAISSSRSPRSQQKRGSRRATCTKRCGAASSPLSARGSTCGSAAPTSGPGSMDSRRRVLTRGSPIRIVVPAMVLAPTGRPGIHPRVRERRSPPAGVVRAPSRASVRPPSKSTGDVQPHHADPHAGEAGTTP